MSKERLEEIKNRRKNYRPDLLPIWFEDMDYLIERVQELEKALELIKLKTLDIQGNKDTRPFQIYGIASEALESESGE